MVLPTLTAYSVLQRSVVAPTTTPGTATVEAEVDYWRDTIGTIISASQLVEDTRLLEVVTRSYGYGDNPTSSTLVLAALEQGAADADGYANRAPDDRLEQIARQFGLAEFGTTGIRDPRFIESMVNRYRAEAAKEGALPEATPIPSTPAEVEAAYFKTQIGGIESAEELVADSSLFRFALTSFGLEAEYINSPFLIEQVLAEGVGDDIDIANQLGDERLQNLSRVFGFGDVDTLNVTDPAFGDSMERRYMAAIGAVQTEAKDGESDESIYFRDNIGTVSTAEELLADTRLFTYVMTAFDLGGETNQTAFVRKVLEEGLSDPAAFANQLSDPRYSDLARNLALSEFGGRNLKDPVILDDIVARYERVTLEVEAGLENPVVELAAYFDRRADTLSSWLFVTADSRLRQVAATALGMPTSMLALDTDRLIEEYEKRYDITDLQDEDKRARFIERYIARADAVSGGSGAGNGYLLGLFSGTPGSGLYSLVSQL